MKLQLWLITETNDARLFSRVPRGTIQKSQIWIPRSVCRCVTKFKNETGQVWRFCEVEVEDWFAEKHQL
jgi:hypothetical protein